MIASIRWSAIRHGSRAVALAAFILGFGTTLAIAQQDQQVTKTPPTSATKAGAAPGDISAWVKVCTKNKDNKNKQVCVVKYEALDPKTGGVLVAVAVSTTEGEDKQDILINVPTAYSLVMPAGVRIKFDEDEPISMRYAVCLPTNCQVHTELTKQVLERMRKAKQMLVAAINMQEKPITFQIPLNGFSKTSEGAPVELDRYQETRARMMEFAKKAAMDQLKNQQANGLEETASEPDRSYVTTAPPKRPPPPAAE
jgi:invasion protein IalB